MGSGIAETSIMWGLQFSDPKFLFRTDGRGSIMWGTRALAAEGVRAEKEPEESRPESGETLNHSGSTSL